MSAYQQNLLLRLTGRGIGLVAISPQTPDGSLSMQENTTCPSPWYPTPAT